jgi:transcriptional regulator with XRE-family HTH domain
MARSEDDGPHPVDRHVGRRVAEKRIALGYNQTELGRALGVTFQQVQKYEKGSNRISASKLWQVAQFFRVGPGYFFEGLADTRAGLAEGEGNAYAHDYPSTRHTIEIGRLAPRLSTARQRLVAEMVRELTDTPE